MRYKQLAEQRSTWRLADLCGSVGRALQLLFFRLLSSWLPSWLPSWLSLFPENLRAKADRLRESDEVRCVRRVGVHLSVLEERERSYQDRRHAAACHGRWDRWGAMVGGIGGVPWSVGSVGCHGRWDRWGAMVGGLGGVPWSVGSVGCHGRWDRWGAMVGGIGGLPWSVGSVGCHGRGVRWGALEGRIGGVPWAVG